MQATGVLYESVWKAISEISWSSNVTKQRAIAFVEFLNRKRHMENTDPMEYTDLARNYFFKKIGYHYRSITKPLLDSGILQSTNYYRPGYYNDEDEYIKGQCLSYRINPELLDDEIIKINYKGEKSKQRCRDATTMKSKQIMRQVRIPDLNSRELIKFVKNSLSDERIRAMLKVNDEIDDSQVHIKGRNHPISIEKVQRRTKDLIKDGKYCHVEHIETYIKRKRRHLTQAYCDQLLRIKHRNIYADRNETNLRLDSNLTNLKSEFMSLLSIDGQRLSQVDLKNSQFRVFVYLLEQVEREILFSKAKSAKYSSELNLAKTANTGNLQVRKEGKEIRGKPVTLLCSIFEREVVIREGLMVTVSRDYKVFKRLVKTGQLYEEICRLMWKETGRQISRKEAKKIMFTIAFSSHRYQPFEKQVVKKYFPSVIGVIDGYKRGAIAELANEGISELVNEEERRETSVERRESQEEECVNGLIGECANEGEELANEEIGELVNGEEGQTTDNRQQLEVHPLTPSKGGKERGISQRGAEGETQEVPASRFAVHALESSPNFHSADAEIVCSPSKGERSTRKEGNASFAILLQQVESLIFIDEILARCHKAGIKALSKHDSIVCRQCDKHKVTKIVCKVLNNLFGRYTYALDIDGDLFDLKPKRKSRLGRVASTLFSQLKVGMNWGNGPPQEAELANGLISKCANGGNNKLGNEDHPQEQPIDKPLFAVPSLNDTGHSSLSGQAQLPSKGGQEKEGVRPIDKPLFAVPSLNDISHSNLSGQAQLPLAQRAQSILGRERVKSGDTAAAILERLGNGMDSRVSEERQRHRDALEEFKRKLQDRRKRSVGRSKRRDRWG